MAVFYDDRDGTIFVTDDSLAAIQTLVGRQAAGRISSASVVVDGQHLNVLNGYKHQEPAAIVPLDSWRLAHGADKVLSINRVTRPGGAVIPLVKVSRS